MTVALNIIKPDAIQANFIETVYLNLSTNVTNDSESPAGLIFSIYNIKVITVIIIII